MLEDLISLTNIVVWSSSFCLKAQLVRVDGWEGIDGAGGTFFFWLESKTEPEVC